MTKRLLTLVVPVAALTLLAGCGSGDETVSDPASAGSTSAPTSAATSSSTPAAKKPDLPSCASTWVEGKTLPARYQGCQVHGQRARSYVYQCEIGSKLATYGRQLYAVPGRPIIKAEPSRAKNKDWKFVFTHCTG